MRPQLRNLEISPFSHNGEDFFHVHDRAGIAPDVQIPGELGPLLSLFDGRRDLEALTREYAGRFGETLSTEFLNRIISDLDKLFLLDSPRFQAHQTEITRDWAAKPNRPAEFAGKSYPTDPKKLRLWLEEMTQKGQKLLPERIYEPENVRGIVVPHIDFTRGGVEESLAYAPLLENIAATQKPFDTLICFGIAHAGVRYPFCGLPKGYETPFGTMEADLELLGDLEKRVGKRFYAEQTTHKTEHSLEFVAVFAQFFEPLQSAKIVPILCGGFWETLQAKQSPLEDSDVAQFVAALREVVVEHEKLGKKIGFVASVDGAHVGSNFGDDTHLTPTKLKRIENADRHWCAAIEAGNSNAFDRHFSRDGNQFNVDAHPAVYTLMAAFPSLRGQLLAYNQAFDAKSNSVVSFASLALFED